MKKRNLSPSDIQEILKRYPDEKSADIAKEFEVPIRTIYSAAKRYGIKKSESFLSSPQSGRLQPGQCLSPETQFKRGQEGPTKGRKMDAIIRNKEKLANWREKRLWKKGHKPYNTGENGEVRWRNNPGYFFIRIKENEWEFLHRWLWVKQNGEIPEGYNIVFKDGNRGHCKIENLECISNAELAERNRHTKYPTELRKAIELKNKLNQTIKHYEQ